MSITTYILLTIALITFTIAIALLVNSILKPSYEHPQIIKFPKDNYPIITLEANDKKYYFLLDSGSNINALDASFAKEFKLTKDSRGGVIVGINGENEKAFYSKCTLKFNKRPVSIVFAVRDFNNAFEPVEYAIRHELSGILGTAFMNEQHIMLDFKNKITYVGKDKN